MNDSIKIKVKVQFEKEIHATSKVPNNFEGFKSYVSETFVQLPKVWSLQYVDGKGEKVSMRSQEDFNEFINLGSVHTSSGKTTRVFVISAEDFQKPRVQNAQGILIMSEYQVIENPESRFQIEKEVLKTLVDNKVNDAVAVSEKQVSEEENAIHKDKENREEKVGQCFLSPRKIKDGIHTDKDLTTSLIEKLDAGTSGSDLAKGEEFHCKNNNKEEQEQELVVEAAVTEISIDNKVNDVAIVSEEQEEKEKRPLNVELNGVLDLIEDLKSKVENASKTVVGINNIGLGQVEVLQKKETKRGYKYIKALHENVRKLNKVFPQEDFDILCAYVHDAPEETTIAELIKNYKH